MAGGAEGSVIVGSPDAPAVTIASADLATMEQLRSLWADFYGEQKSMGLLAPIPADGFDRWVQSFAGTLGRFSVVFIARGQDGAVGFVAGRLRQQPPHYGGGMAGLVSDLYVQPALQGQGLGRQLLDTCIDWFTRQRVGRLELQVVAGNRNAAEFYAHVGWKVEFLQLVKEIE